MSAPLKLAIESLERVHTTAMNAQLAEGFTHTRALGVIINTASDSLRALRSPAPPTDLGRVPDDVRVGDVYGNSAGVQYAVADVYKGGDFYAKVSKNGISQGYCCYSVSFARSCGWKTVVRGPEVPAAEAKREAYRIEGPRSETVRPAASPEPTPAKATTAGQIAHAAYLRGADLSPSPWSAIGNKARRGWDTAAQAVLAAQPPKVEREVVGYVVKDKSDSTYYGARGWRQEFTPGQSVPRDVALKEMRQIRTGARGPFILVRVTRAVTK